MSDTANTENSNVDNPAATQRQMSQDVDEIPMPPDTENNNAPEVVTEPVPDLVPAAAENGDVQKAGEDTTGNTEPATQTEVTSNGPSDGPPASQESPQPVGSPEAQTTGSPVANPQAADPEANPEQPRKNSKKKLKRHMTEEEIEEEEMIYGAVHVIMLFIPVSLCLLFVVATVSSVEAYRHKPTQYLPYTPFHEEDDRPEVKLLESVLNALIVIGIIIFMTFLLFLLYKYKCYMCLLVWITFCLTIMLAFFSIEFLGKVFIQHNVAVDYITMGIILWNSQVVGMMSIFWRGPLIVQQFYLIYASALMALVFISMLPSWTVWTLLGSLSIWDLIAVLCPKGPLRQLVELAQERNEPILPGLIYSSTMVWPIVTMADGEERVDEQGSKSGILATRKNRVGSDEEEGDASKSSVTKSERRVRLQTDPVEQDEEFEEQERGIKLGLGDFIFYSVLVGKASLYGDWNTTIACFVAILVGLCSTLALLAIYRKALPALPISILCGILFYFCTSIIIQPFVVTCSANQVYL